MVLTEPNAQVTQITAKQVPLTDVLLNFHTGLHKPQTPVRSGDLFLYRGSDKSLAQPGRKQATATEVFDVHISYL